MQFKWTPTTLLKTKVIRWDLNLSFNDLILKCLTFEHLRMINAFHAFDILLSSLSKILCQASTHQLNET